MQKIITTGMAFLVAFFALLILTPTVALASGNPVRSETIAAGAYIIDVNFYQDPPYVDQALDIAVVPHDHTSGLSGEIIAQPGLGTDAVVLHARLTPTGDTAGTLRGSVHLPVRGAWDIKVHLDGPRGSGEASLPVTAAAPGALPAWLAWLIGSSPLVFIAVWIGFQHRYRRSLMAQQSA